MSDSGFTDPAAAPRRRAAWIALATVAALAAASCKKDEEPARGLDAPPPRTTTADVPVRSGTAERPPTPRAQKPVEFDLHAEPLTVDSARRTLVESAGAAASPEAVRDALYALAATSTVEALREAAAPSLAPGADTGGYDDADAAACALTALIRAGDGDAARKAVDLGKAAVADDAATPAILEMLAAVEGGPAAEARRSLVALLDSSAQDDAVRAIAPLREPSAAEALHAIAAAPDGDEAPDDGVRATATAGLLALGDPRAQAAAEDMVRRAATESAACDVLDGLAARGVPEVLPWLRKIADPVVAEGDNSNLEIASLAASYVDVRGAGKGTPEDIATLRGLLGKDDGMADDEVIVALWSLGDDQQAIPAAEVLVRYVKGVASAFDEDLAVRLLDAVGARKAAGDAAFAKAIDAAAQVPIPADPKRNDAAGRAWRVRVAAARAYLASRR